jgi:hypothetical protein
MRVLQVLDCSVASVMMGKRGNSDVYKYCSILFIY